MQHFSRLAIAATLLILSACIGMLSRMGPAAPTADTLAQTVATVVPTVDPMLAPPNPTAAADQAPGLPEFLPSLPLSEGMHWITDTDYVPESMRPFVDAVYIDPSPDLADVSVCDREQIEAHNRNPDATADPLIDVDKQPIGCKAAGLRPRRTTDNPTGQISSIPPELFMTPTVTPEVTPSPTLTPVMAITVSETVTVSTEITSASMNAVARTYAINSLNCRNAGGTCLDNNALRDVRFDVRTGIPDTTQFPDSYYYYGARAHVGSDAVGTFYPCGSSNVWPNMAAGSAWGKWNGGEAYDIRPFSEMFCAQEGAYIPLLYPFTLSVYQTTQYRIYQVSAGPGAKDSVWRTAWYDTSTLQWIPLQTATYVNKFRDAAWVEVGFELGNTVNNDLGTIKIGVANMDKVQFAGYLMPAYSPWDDEGWPAYWWGKTDHLYGDGWNIRSCDEDEVRKHNWTSLSVDLNQGEGISSCPGY